MAEKITERKEYRGLGYAPTISVPGLVQARPVGATRAPASNELLRLAKNLERFGEVFGTAMLRKASREDEEAERLAKEDFLAWPNAYPGETQRSGAANIIPGGVGGRKGEVQIPDRRAQLLTATEYTLPDLVAKGVIRREATPAYVAYLKREAARSLVATKYSSLLEARINEAAIFESGPEGVNTEARARDIIEIVDQELQKTYGPKWHIWAPEEVKAAEAKFISTVQSKNLDNRTKFANKTYIENVKSVFLADTHEQFLINIERLATEGHEQGLEISKLTGAAAISSVTHYLAQDQPEMARILAERVQDAQVKGAGYIISVKDQDVLERLIDQADGESRDSVKENAAIARQVIAQITSETLNKEWDGKIPTEEQLTELALKLLEREINTGKKVMGPDGKLVPRMVKIGSIDSLNRKFTESTIREMISDEVYAAPTRKLIGTNRGQEIQRLINIGDEPKLKEARKILEESTSFLSPAALANFDNQIKLGQRIAAVAGHTLYQEMGRRAVTDASEARGLSGDFDSIEDIQKRDTLARAILHATLENTQERLREYLNENENVSVDDRDRKTREFLEKEYEKAKADLLGRPQTRALFEKLQKKERERRAGVEPPSVWGFPEWYHRDGRGPWADGEAAFLNRKRKDQRDRMGEVLTSHNFWEGYKSGESLTKFLTRKAASGKKGKEQVAAYARVFSQLRANANHALRGESQISKKLAESGLLDKEEQEEIYEDIAQYRRITGFTPQEIISGKIKLRGVEGDQYLDIKKLTELQKHGVEKVLLNPYEVPLFKNIAEINKLQDEEGHPTIKKMMMALGIPVTNENAIELIGVQVNLLRLLGRGNEAWKD